MARFTVLTFLLFSTFFLRSQSIIIDKSVTILWDENKEIFQPNLDEIIVIPNFEGAETGSSHLLLPSYGLNFNVPGPGKLSIKITNEKYDQIDLLNTDFSKLSQSLEIKHSIAKARNQHIGSFNFIPIVNSGNNNFEKLISFDLQVIFEPSDNNSDNITFRGSPFKTTSALSTGRWYKISTDKPDVYKLSADYFTNQLQVEASSIDPTKIKIYGNGGGTVPQLNSATRVDDLEEVAIKFYGDTDNIFEAGEYFLFYAESPDDVSYNESDQKFNFQKNHYSFSNHYFITIDGLPGKRIQENAQFDSPTRFTSEYYDVQRYEQESNNLLDFRQDAHGSGKKWFGDRFSTNGTKDFSDQFELDNYVTSKEIKWYADLMVVSFSGTSRFKVNIGSDINESTYHSILGHTSHTNSSGIVKSRSGNINLTSPNLSNVAIEFFPSSAESTGFLDYIQLEGYKNLIFKSTDNSRMFRDIVNSKNETTQYTLSSNNTAINIWNISNKKEIKNIPFNINPSGAIFNLSGQLMNEFLAFDPDRINNIPDPIGAVNNQNLHSITKADMLVIYHPDFKSVADRFIAYREGRDQFVCASASIEEVYNEFSGGSVDATGIRDMCKMIYSRDTTFKYLLLMGDGTFDMRHIKDGVENQNYICTYQTTESNVSIYSYPADDYFGLLDDEEGSNLDGGLEISIGRFPIQKEQQGHDILDKIIAYESDANINGDWKQRIMLIADDEDNNLHFNQTEQLASNLSSTYKNFEINKLHFDAFQQESSSAGSRYPEVNERINNGYEKGQFIINYIGHGGNKALGQERVITIPQILTWDRKNGFPILLTATCSFSSYDDPDFTSAGELSILKANGGAVALMSTVRLVFAQDNFTLVKELFKTFLEPKDDGRIRRIGDVYLDAKTRLVGGTLENARKFELFGDPSMIIPLPQLEVYTSQINDEEASTFSDTIGALQRITVNGFIGKDNKVNSNFNGELFIKVLDKPIKLVTKGQDGGSRIAEFEVQNTTLYQGRVSVINGLFNYEFIVPRDINYVYGEGKILHYAKTNNGLDASGYKDGIIIGGTAKNPVIDNQPPSVELFMDDESFVSGNTVTKNPVLLANLSDDFGINISGTSIGHDITSIIDADNKTTSVLNEFYTPSLDQSAQGRVEYQLKDIEPGLHTITVQAWDIANNKGEASIEFLVMDKEGFSLDQIFNYPNPFTTSTKFQFEHDLPSSALDVQIDIYTVSGNRVKTIQESVISNGQRVSDIAWDGLDEYGDDLARGVYLYKITVRSDNNGTSTSFTGESDFERLVILK